MNNIFIDLLEESKVVIVYRKHLFRVFYYMFTISSMIITTTITGTMVAGVG
jgi:hypothetical protein